MKPISWLLILFVGGCQPCYAGTGYDFKRGGLDYNDSYFGGKFLVRTETCVNSKGELEIAVKNTPNSDYPSCLDFGWKNYDEFDTDSWGNEKCDSVCKSAIYKAQWSKAKETCLERPEETDLDKRVRKLMKIVNEKD